MYIIKRVLYRLLKRFPRMQRRWTATKINFAWLFPNGQIAQTLRHYHSRDRDENLRTSPRDNERVDFQAVWVAEIYTPSHAKSLEEALLKIEALRDDAFRTHLWDSASWLREVRAASLGGGWKNLGPLVDSENRSLYSLDSPIRLPSGMRRAETRLFHLTSSINCLVLGFQPNDDTKCRIDHLARANYATYLQPTGRGYKIVEPEHQKEMAVTQFRLELRKELADWVREHAPGAFASKSGGVLPTLEFDAFAGIEPFQMDGDRGNPFLATVGAGHSFEIWRAVDLAGFNLTFDSTHDQEKHFALLTATTTKLEKLNKGNYQTAFSFLDERISPLVSRWACMALLDLYEERTNRVRDARRNSTGRRGRATMLKQLQELAVGSIDVATITPELAQFARENHLFDHGMDDFTLAPRNGEKDAITLAASFKRSITRRSRHLRTVEQALRTLLLEQGTLIATLESLRLQRRITRLTVFLAILTGILVLTGILALREIGIEGLWNMIQAIAISTGIS